MTRSLYRYRSFNTERITGISGIDQSVINIEKWKFEAFEGLVYPSSPLYFNDPYDCEFCIHPDALLEILDRQTYIKILEEQFRLKPKEKKKILNAKNIGSTIQQILCNHGVKFKKSLVNVLQDKLNSSMSEVKDSVRVVCLSEVKDSMLMWSHYAQNHTGFCIEYEFETNDKFDIFLTKLNIQKIDILFQNQIYQIKNQIGFIRRLVVNLMLGRMRKSGEL